MSDYDYLFKVIVVGDGAVGKTALTIRFAEGRFQDHYKMTIGVDFAIKMVEIGGKRVKLQIWDTGGQERFSYIRPLYYKGAMGVVYVFDITNRASFEHLPKWHKEVSDYCGNIPALLVANKCDLPDKAVTPSEAQGMATQLGGPFYEASAKTGDNVDDLFTQLGRILIQQEGVVLPAPAPTPAPAPAAAPAPSPMPAPTPAPAPAAAPAPSPMPAPTPAPAPTPVQSSSDSLEEALAFLNTPEEEPAPAPTPAPTPISVPEPKPIPIPSPNVTPAPAATPQPVPIPETPKPQAAAPFSQQPQPAPETKPAAPAPASSTSPAPFTSFLTTSKPKSQESTFIPFIPKSPASEQSKPITPVPASPSEPITLEVAPKAAPAPSPPPQKTCPNCGKVISARWKFCTYCGTPLK
ncbi:MAG: GTP-binding protein [Candidatus Helarchaeota archaeon]